MGVGAGRRAHTIPPLFLNVQMWNSTRVVNSCQCPHFFLSLCLSRQPSEPVLSALLLIFIFPQNFNCFVRRLSCPSIVSAPTTAMCGCSFTVWLRGVDSISLYFITHSHVVLSRRAEKHTGYYGRNMHRFLWHFFFFFFSLVRRKSHCSWSMNIARSCSTSDLRLFIHCCFFVVLFCLYFTVLWNDLQPSED